MTRNEYIQLLTEGLKDVDESISREVISDCQLHFNSGLAFGKNEAVLCEELGDVQELIAGCIQMQEEARESSKEKPVFSIVKAPDENPVYRRMQVSCSNLEARIVPSTDGDIHIYLENNSDEYYALEEAYMQDTYCVNVVRKKTPFSLKNLLLWVKLKIELPAGMDRFLMKSTNGMLTMQEITANEIEMATANGAVALKDVKGGMITAHSNNGAVKLQQCEAERMDVSTTNGAVTGEAVYFTKGRFVSRNGYVKVRIDARDREYIAQVSTKVGHTKVRDAADIFKLSASGISVDDCIQVMASTFCGSVDIAKV